MSDDSDRHADGDDLGGDYQLTRDAIRRLMREVARVFSTEGRALLLLEDMDFPREMIPNWDSSGTPLSFWSLIFTDLGNSVVAAPYRRLITAARGLYGQNQVFADLDLEHGKSQEPSPVPAQPTAGPESAHQPGPSAGREVGPQPLGCHVIAWTRDARVRDLISRWLESELLHPRPVWSAHEMTSFAVDETDDARVRALIASRYARLLVKVVPPGQPDELIGRLRVADADGREIIVPNVPVLLTVAELGAIAARYHPAAASSSGRTVNGQRRAEFALHIGDGVRQQVQLDETLLWSGIRDDHRVVLDSVRFAAIRVVFAGASPRRDNFGQLSQVRFSRELDQIRAKARLGHITVGGEFTHVTRRHLPEIMQREPDIIHLVCHGRDGRLYLEDDDGDADDVPASWLAEMIAERAGRQLSGIVLSACEGESAGPLLTPAARDVITHKGLLPDNLAIDFTGRFYDELARMPVLRIAAKLADESGHTEVFPPAQGDS